MHLVLVRHGETLWNAQHRYLGHTDMPLDEVGFAQAEAIAERLRDWEFDAFYASDLLRVRQTTQAINNHHHLTIHFDPRLREISFGDWEGLTYDEAKARDPQTIARRASDPTTPPPNGESLPHFTERIHAFLSHLRETHHPEQRLLLVGHGGSLRMMVCRLLGLPPEKYWQFRLDNASLSEILLYDSGAILTKFNETAHLGFVGENR